MIRKLSITLTLVGISLLAVVSIAGAQNHRPQAATDAQTALGTGFTYQGYLTDGGTSVNGACDVRFSLWDAAGGGGTQIGAAQTRDNTYVKDGLFTAQLDFGSTPFTGGARWLEIGVRCPAGSGSFATLSPRQAITPAPYALGLRPGALISGTGVAPSYAGLVVNMEGATGLRVDAASYDGVHVKAAGFDGIYVGSAGDYGVNIMSAATGLRVYSATLGLSVASADTGVRVHAANSDGLHVDSAAADGLEIETAMTGVRVGTAGAGVLINSATTGMTVVSATTGMNIVSANAGVHVGSVIDGVIVQSADEDGLRVVSANDGVVVESATADGLRIESAGTDGVDATSTSALSYGGRFVNDASGGVGAYVRAGDSSTPDLVLAGTMSGDGRLSSDPASSTSDLVLLGYDYVDVHLDEDDNGSSLFRIYESGNFPVFWVDELGNTDATGTKSAIVSTSSFGARKLYAVESPGVWFEDFGAAQLASGQATVPIEPIFGQTVDLTEYHVFLTPLGDCPLYVAEKTAISFGVKAMGGETCDIPFDYRIVARRLGYEHLRLETASLDPAEGSEK